MEETSMDSRKMPKYEAVYRKLKDDIVSGRLKSGEKLPSRRSLSADMGISTVTVEAAYSQLAAEGYIYTRQRSGCYVSSLISSLPEKDVLEKRTEERIPNEPKKLTADFTGRDAGDMFPQSIWARLMRGTLTRSDLSRPMDFHGVYELRRAIAKHLARTRGMDADPDNIIIGAGTEHLCNMIVQLLGQDRVYAAEDPGYATIAKIFLANGVNLAYASVDEQGAVIDGLKADVLHISPSHHFPTGISMSPERRLDALRWVRGGKYIIEDEYDSELRLKGMPIEPLMNLDTTGNVIYMNTFTKSISPTLRISYMILSPKLMGLFEKKLGFYSCAVAAVEQYTLADFIEQGWFDKHVNRLKTHSRKMRAKLLEAMERSDIAKSVIERDAGLHFMIELDTDKDDETLSKILLENGVRLPFLSHYMRTRDERNGHIAIMNYAALDEGSIDKAIEVIEGVL